MKTSTPPNNCNCVGDRIPRRPLPPFIFSQAPLHRGNISRFGVDIGYIQGGILVWTVFAPSNAVAPGALAGTYAGATASATVGVGVGANALVGGFNSSFALQPLSVEANRGLNVAAGIGAMTLTPAR